MGVTPLGRGWRHGAMVRPQPGSLSMANLSMVVGMDRPIIVELSQNGENATELSIRLSLPSPIPLAKVCLPPCFGVEPATAMEMTVAGSPCSAVTTEGRFLCCEVKRRASGEALVVARSLGGDRAERARVQVKTDDTEEKPPPPNPLALSHMPTIVGSDFPDFRAVFSNGECDASDPGYPKGSGINLNKTCFSCFRIPALLRNRQTGTMHAFAEVLCRVHRCAVFARARALVSALEGDALSCCFCFRALN